MSQASLKGARQFECGRVVLSGYSLRDALGTCSGTAWTVLAASFFASVFLNRVYRRAAYRQVLAGLWFNHAAPGNRPGDARDGFETLQPWLCAVHLQLQHGSTNQLIAISSVRSGTGFHSLR